MMKKVLFICLLAVIIFNFLAIPVFSTTKDIDSLGSIELKLFNHKYSKETPQKRLDRIEYSIFGRTYGQSTELRITRINNLFTSLSKKQVPVANSQIADDRSATDYPAVTQLELRVFQQAFVKEDIASRLSRLESKVFGSTFPNDGLADRMDRLKSVVSQENKAPYADNSNEIIIPDSQTSSGNSYLQGNLSALEQNILGQTYENDMINQRLDRLEIKAFGATQPGTEDARLSRLNSIVENSCNVPVNQNRQNSLMANSMQSSMQNSMQNGFNDSFFDDQSHVSSQKSGFLGFLENLALPVLSAFLNRNNSYAAYPYGYPSAYTKPYSYNPGYYHPYQYSVPYMPGYWNGAYNNSYSQGGVLQSQGVLNSNYGMGVHILPY